MTMNRFQIEMQARLHEVLRYDPDSGVFTWKTSLSHRRMAGAEAGSTSKAWGYRIIGFDGVTYRAHRLAWLYVYGEWPDKHLDHINGDRLDNRLVNLRPCNDAENNQNLGMNRRNVSGYTGVSWDKKRCKWFSSIQIDGKTRALGRFRTSEEAYRAYLIAKRETHPFQRVPRGRAA